MAFQLPPTTTTASTGFAFGVNPAAATTTAAAVGGVKPAFSFSPSNVAQVAGGGDADSMKAATSLAPAPQFGLGLPAASTASAPVMTAALGGLATGSVVAPAPAPAVATTAAAPAPLFGGFMAQPATTATKTTAAAAPVLSLGLASTPKTTAAIAPVAQPVAPAAALPQLASTTAPTTTTGTGSAFANLSTATKTTDSASVIMAPQLSYNQLEEYMNKWTLEFEEQEKVFTEQATEINAWDKLLVSNNLKILDLNDAVQKVKKDQQLLDQELEFIATQHKELEESLAPLEKEFASMPRVDIERSHTYLMVETLDTQLKQMSEDLKEIIDNLNEANKEQDSTDPIIQIGKILNAHMSSLQWIETQSNAISKKLEDVGQIQDTQKRDVYRSNF